MQCSGCRILLMNLCMSKQHGKKPSTETAVSTPTRSYVQWKIEEVCSHDVTVHIWKTNSDRHYYHLMKLTNREGRVHVCSLTGNTARSSRKQHQCICLNITLTLFSLMITRMVQLIFRHSQCSLHAHWQSLSSLMILFEKISFFTFESCGRSAVMLS